MDLKEQCLKGRLIYVLEPSDRIVILLILALMISGRKVLIVRTYRVNKTLVINSENLSVTNRESQ